MSRFYVFPKGQGPADYNNVTVDDLSRAVEVVDWTADPEEVFTYSPEMNALERIFQDCMEQGASWDGLPGLVNEMMGRGNGGAVD